MNDFLLSKHGTKIAYQQQVGKEPGVIFLGGFMSDMSGIKAQFLGSKCDEWGLSYVRFDYFGHGISEGVFEKGSISHWLEDTLLVIDQLTKGPQILVGSSMGGWLMVLAAKKRIERIHALVGIAAAPDFLADFDRLSQEQQQALDQDGICYIPSQYRERPYAISKHLIQDGKHHQILDKTNVLNCKVRLLHGLSDRDVPWQRSLQLLHALTSEDINLTLIKEGNHRLSEPPHLEILAETLRLLIS